MALYCQIKDIRLHQYFTNVFPILEHEVIKLPNVILEFRVPEEQNKRLLTDQR